MYLLATLKTLSVTDIVAVFTLIFVLASCLLVWVIKVERKIATFCLELRGVRHDLKGLKQFHREHIQSCTINK